MSVLSSSSFTISCSWSLYSFSEAPSETSRSSISVSPDILSYITHLQLHSSLQQRPSVNRNPGGPRKRQSWEYVLPQEACCTGREENLTAVSPLSAPTPNNGLDAPPQLSFTPPESAPLHTEGGHNRLFPASTAPPHRAQCVQLSGRPQSPARFAAWLSHTGTPFACTAWT